ncbi:hypothetical protein [Prolixibacter sp. NT017]|uniref:hypothetical protein n=1 Tax=Prolixibacter sp. NT017 TaxID=2652390 RepID=UPI0012994F9F|nr:hypothetical protein [Prolixibacter sp. NT017]
MTAKRGIILAKRGDFHAKTAKIAAKMVDTSAEIDKLFGRRRNVCAGGIKTGQDD